MHRIGQTGNIVINLVMGGPIGYSRVPVADEGLCCDGWLSPAGRSCMSRIRAPEPNSEEV